MRRAEKPVEEKGKVKFRFVEFEMEGGSASLEETIRSISHAITRGGTATQRLVPAARSAAPAAQSPDEGNDIDVEPEEMEPGEPPAPREDTNQRNNVRKRPPSYRHRGSWIG